MLDSEMLQLVNETVPMDRQKLLYCMEGRKVKVFRGFFSFLPVRAEGVGSGAQTLW